MGEILMRQMFYAALENFNLGEFSPLVGIHFHPSGKDAGRKQRVDLDSEGAGFFSCPSFAKGRRNIPLFGTGCVFSSVQPGGLRLLTCALFRKGHVCLEPTDRGVLLPNALEEGCGHGSTE